MPISQRLREAAALDSTYSKAIALATGGGVLTCDDEPGKINGVMHVSGSVKASHGSPYRASVSLDLAEQDVIDCSCTCPASYNYPGPCKHAVALALYYLDAAGIEALPYTGRGRTPTGGTKPVKPRKPAAKPTSPQLAKLFSAITNERVDAAAALRATRTSCEAPSEPAELLVTLMPSNDYYSEGVWLLKLRVRRGKASYVVKNMGELVHAWETHDEILYGKNLSLVHRPEAFTERSRAIMGLVSRVVHSQQALFASRYGYWSVGSGTGIKDLPIAEADVVELFDILQGSSFTFDPNYSLLYLPACSPRVISGDPLVRATIRTARDGGYDLELPRRMLCFASECALYLVDTECAWRCSPEFATQASTLFRELLPANAPVHIAPGDAAIFCRTVLPQLDAATALDAPQQLRDLVPPTPEFRFRIGLEDGRVFCDPTVSYGDTTMSIYAPPAPGQPSRDVAAEFQTQDVVEAYFPGLGAAGDGMRPDFDESDDELLYLLLTEGLRELSELGEVLLSERLRAIEVRESPQVKVKATMASGLLDLEVGASGLSPADLAAYLASYKRKQKYLRLSNGDILRLDGSVRALNDLAEGLGVEPQELASGVSGLPSNRALFVDALLKKADRVRLERNAGFRSLVREFDTFSDADFEVPATLADVLRPYQVDGFRWLETLERFGFGGILADDMGLGKTLQVIAHVLARREEAGDGPTLVVCPASLVYNWMAELERFAPQLRAAAVIGTKAQRRMIIAGAFAPRSASGAGGTPEAGTVDCPDVLVTSYDLMKRDVEEYAAEGHLFARVILDEAQYIKNPTTQAAKCAKCLPARVRFALTGTPIESRLTELWSIFDFLMPGVLGGRDAFAQNFEGPVENNEAGAAWKLQCMVSPFILRRLKENVLADLPDKNESVVYAQLDGEQEKLYKACQDRLALQIAHELPDEFKKKKLQVLAELTKLRQLCCDPRLYFEDYKGGSAKLDTCLELVRSALDAGHRILVFSQFTSMLDLISDRLRSEKIDHLVLTGSTSKEQRAHLVERFQAGEAPVFLISLKAGGVGLNLTAADVVIHYDPWWNTAAQDQATDRAHRIGQTRSVSVFKLVAKGTIEESIVQMQERKRDLAESVLGGEGMASTSLTRDDVLTLLGAGTDA